MNLRINTQITKKLYEVPGVLRHLLLILQQKPHGSLKIPTYICKGHRGDLKKHVEKLAKIKVDFYSKIEGSSKQKREIVPLFAIDPHTKEAAIKYHRGTITYEFSDKVKTLLLGKQYFTIDMAVYMHLRSQSLKLMYELLCQFLCTGKIGFFADGFKKYLAIGNRRWKDAEAFKKDFFDPLVAQLEQKTSFRIRRDRDGDVIVRIGKFVYFDFYRIENKEEEKETLKYSSIYQRMLKKGVPASLASRSVIRLGETFCSNIVRTVSTDKSDGYVKDETALLIARLLQALQIIEYNADRRQERKNKIKENAARRAAEAKKANQEKSVKEEKNKSLSVPEWKQSPPPEPPKKRKPLQRVTYDKPKRGQQDLKSDYFEILDGVRAGS